MRRRIAIVGAVVALAVAGCGSWQADTRTKLDVANTATTVAYGLIQAQAATGTVTGNLTQEQFDAEVAKATAAFALVSQTYAEGLAAIAADDKAGAEVAAGKIIGPMIVVLQVKAVVCPAINPPEDDE